MRGHWRGALGLSLLCAAAVLGPPDGRPAAATAAPIAIIGVDAADWRAIDPLVAARRLPAFEALKAAGAVGVMRPEPPLLSPIIWTTIATGRRPEDHRVLDFMVDQPGGGQLPVSGGARLTKALWEIFSDAGRPVLVAGWWATWPPDRVRGVVVSDRLAVPHMRLDSVSSDVVHPADRVRDVVAARVDPQSIDYAALNRLVPLSRAEFDKAVAAERGSPGLYRDRFAHARAALAATRTYAAVTTRLLPSVQPAYVAVYFDLVDAVSHLFIKDPVRRDRAIEAAYAEIDQQIRAIARALVPDTLVIVLSDHGFHTADAGIADDPADLTSGAAAWHRPYGMIGATTAGALAGTRETPKLMALGAVSPLDLAPTLLARANLPVGADMPGRILIPLTDGAAVTKIATHGTHRLPEQAAAADRKAAAAELDRLRSLGYVSGAAAITAQARVNLGEILFRKGAMREAVGELEAAVAADPANQRAGLWLARAYSSSNRPDDAVRVYDRLLRAAVPGAPVDAMIVLAATDVDVTRGRQTAAADRLARVPPAMSRAPEVQLARAALADAEGKPVEAERLFTAAYAAQPENFETVSRLVDWLLRNGRAAAAAKVAADAANRFPGSPERRALAGEAALASQRPIDAGREFRYALAMAPDAASARIGLARAELSLRRPDAALGAIGDLTGRDVEMLRGSAHSMKRNWTAAVDAYASAARQGQPSIELLNALGNAQLEAGRPLDAVGTLERSLMIKADQPTIRNLLDRARAQASRSR